MNRLDSNSPHPNRQEKILGTLALATVATSGLVLGFRLVRLLGVSLLLFRRKTHGEDQPVLRE